MGHGERHVAFVRNVMIGREGLTRAVLLEIFRRNGAEDPVSYISTGNVGFGLPAREVPALSADVERSLEAVIGRQEPVFVRSLGWLADRVDERPFDGAPFENPHERIVSLAPGPPPVVPELPLISERGDFAVFRIDGTEVYSVSRLVDGTTRSPGGVVERLCGRPITSRSWNTIERVVAKELAR